MIIAQITDLHVASTSAPLFGRVDTREHFRRAIDHLRGISPLPDLLVLTGDLADTGSPEEYRFVREALDQLSIPSFIIPGNHDKREALREVFQHHQYLPRSGYIQYLVSHLPLQLIGLDTLAEGHGHGELCQERLDWLDARLAQADKPVILFMHHPPAATGLDAIDEMGLRVGAERLAEIVQRHRNVERILCGHVHRPISFRWAGTMVCVAPSSAHQATLDLAPGAELTFMMDPPAVGLHQWMPPTGLVSHLSFIGPFSGPHSF
ncbi:MAG: phosphodiesterase [Alphaproteobacteria bacterium]|nr:phosphodiesterase [Alphaproteobacteria bacterium]